MTEELVFWSHVLHGLSTAARLTTPIGIVLQGADVEASLVLKAMNIRRLEKIEALEEVLEEHEKMKKES